MERRFGRTKKTNVNFDKNTNNYYKIKNLLL